MRRWMRFVEDTQAEGRFFPRGAEVEAIDAGAHALVLPDAKSYASLCAVPRKRLVVLKSFRVVLLNRQVGLADTQIRLGVDEADVRAALQRRAPQCEVLDVVVDSST